MAFHYFLNTPIGFYARTPDVHMLGKHQTLVPHKVIEQTNKKKKQTFATSYAIEKLRR